MRQRLIDRAATLIVLLAVRAASAADVPSDVPRLQTERAHQQNQLQLKMQQQQERAVRPLPPSADFAVRQLEQEQQQRQRSGQDDVARRRVGEPVDDAARISRELETERAGQLQAEEAQRFHYERQTEKNRSREAPDAH